MDAGTSAVLGALAGSVATIGAAFVTSRAQREGARITARAEHRKERREPRYRAYKEFLEEASTMRSLTEVFHAPGYDISRDRITEDFTQTCSELTKSIQQKSTVVALEGPAKIARSVTRIAGIARVIDAALVWYMLVSEVDSPKESRRARRSLSKWSMRYLRAVDKFMFRAQAALDDDGSQK